MKLHIRAILYPTHSVCARGRVRREDDFYISFAFLCQHSKYRSKKQSLIENKINCGEDTREYRLEWSRSEISDALGRLSRIR